VVLEVLDELATLLPRKHPAAFVLAERPEIAYPVLGGVVQVRGTLERALVVFEDAEEVREVVAVPAYLQDRMQIRSARHAVHRDELIVALPALGSAPLLELDDDVRVFAGPRVSAGQDRVDPLAG
jgi:hypothetical protein